MKMTTAATLIVLFSVVAVQASEPTTVTTCQGLAKINENLSGNYILGNDIDFTINASDSDAEKLCKWSLPNIYQIGFYHAPFKGKFDGNGYSLKNYSAIITRNEAGIFGYINGATIKNVTLDNVHITGQGRVGLLVGSNQWWKTEQGEENPNKANTIQNITIKNSTLITDDDYVGAVVGKFFETMDGSKHIIENNTYKKVNIITPKFNNVNRVLGGDRNTTVIDELDPAGVSINGDPNTGW